MLIPYDDYVISEPAVTNLGGFDVVGTSQSLLRGKVLEVPTNNTTGINKSDIIVFEVSECYEYMTPSCGKVFIVPKKAILAIEQE